MSSVLVEKKEHIAVITINRPEALNALNTETLKEIDKAITEVEQDNDVYVAILTGSGKAFVAGADIKEMSAFTAVEGKEFGIFGNEVFLKIENMKKPIIAAVNGYALGGGCELAMACDIRIASEKAKFGQPEVGLGITPGFGGSQRLPRYIGISRAMELMLTGDNIDALQAKEYGLVNNVYAAEELIPEAMKLAAKIASRPQVPVWEIKRSVRKGMQADINTAVAFESEAFGLCFSTEDQKDAMQAFVEKRKISEFKNK